MTSGFALRVRIQASSCATARPPRWWPPTSNGGPRRSVRTRQTQTQFAATLFGRFLAGKGAGPLFYDPARRRGGKSRRPQNHKIGGKIADWVHAIGVDEEAQPNHGWRHRFNYVARKVGVDPEVRDAIKGHVARAEGEKYGGDVPLEAKWVAIKKFPRYDVAPPVGPRPVSATAKKASKKRMETAKRAKERRVGAGGGATVVVTVSCRSPPPIWVFSARWCNS
jgi:hypothetical protein